MARAGLCIGCGGCAAGVASAQMRFDRYGQLKPDGPRSWAARPSERLARTCPFSPRVRDEDTIALERFPTAAHRDGRIGRFESAYVGHVEEGEYRARGSSGGMSSWMAAELLRTGLVDGVAHVAPVAQPSADGRLFRYSLARSLGELNAGAKSRYYPVDLMQVIEAIRETPGRYAVTGVPCFIKAIHLLRAEDPVLRERIAFTLGLFCGHSKSARMAESFAWQLGARREQVAAIDYRLKDASRPANWYRAHLTLHGGETRAQDWWHLVDGDWGAGFFQNAACNFCDDVTAETADISFGDAWVEPYSSDGRGTNVVVSRSPVVDAMVRAAIADGRLQLETVDADFVHETQAAGLRHRREGLALRLSRRRGLRPRKRVAAMPPPLPARRRAVYRLRQAISAWSHRVFWIARRTQRPVIYTAWARAALALYQGVTYSRGWIGAVVDRLESAFARKEGDRPTS